MNLDKLPVFLKRSFIFDDADFSRISTVRKYFDSLLNRIVENKDDFDKWLNDKSELDKALDQFRAILYIKMTSDTTNEEYGRNFKEFTKNIVPEIKKSSDLLDRKILLEFKSFLDEDETFKLFLKKKQNQCEIFQDENIPMQTKESLLSSEYQSIAGNMMVEVEGNKLTMQMAQKLLESPKRYEREKIWHKMNERRLKDKERIGKIFNELVEIRHSISNKAGFGNFADYQFRVFERFDYSQAQCIEFHDSIQEFIVPLYQKVLLKRRKTLKLDELRPWDIICDTNSQEPLKPFNEVGELIKKSSLIFHKLNADFGAEFELLNKFKLLDLKSRKGKAPGGYQSTLCEARKPFIFMNAVGTDQDLRTLFHECGHAFHVNLSRHISLFDYISPPIEFCEVASMSMELFCNDFIGCFYSPDECKRSIKRQLENIIFIFPWVAIIDAFQHWIYKNPVHSERERQEMWVEIYKRFSGNVVNWKGYENELAVLWHKQLHVFEYPFYYIEYAIAQLGALNMWKNYKSDPEQTITMFKKGLSFGGSKSLKELFKLSGLKLDFSRETISEIADFLEKIWNEYE